MDLTNWALQTSPKFESIFDFVNNRTRHCSMCKFVEIEEKNTVCDDLESFMNKRLWFHLLITSIEIRQTILLYRGAKSDWDFRISDLVKNPDETDINFCAEFRLRPEGPVSQIHSFHLHVGAPMIFSELLKSVQMLKREWGEESNGKLSHIFNPW